MSENTKPAVNQGTHPALRDVHVYLSLSMAMGSPAAGDAIRVLVGRFDWRKTFVQVASLAACWARNDKAALRSLLLEPLLARTSLSTNPGDQAVARLLAANPDATIVHEEVCYLLESLAILVGDESGKEADLASLALMVLAANDHTAGWSSPDVVSLTPEQHLMADIFRIARFNRYPDPLREIARAAIVFDRVPPRGPLHTSPDLWSALQRDALGGLTIAEYLDRFGVPLFMMSQQWGTDVVQGTLSPPFINPAAWYSATRLGVDEQNRAVRFFNSLTMTRDEARFELTRSLRRDGLPHSPSLFVAHPFVRINDEVIVPSSPWMVAEHLRGGLWRRLLDASKRQHSAERWFSAFGDMVEMACRDTAANARMTKGFPDQVILSEKLGDQDEVEDVVVQGASGLAMFSAKASRIEHVVARESYSRRRVVEWLDVFLFAPRSPKRRGGALRLLSANIDRIRSGARQPLQSSVPIFPVLVCFDDFGDGVGVARFIDRRCAELGLLNQPQVAPVALLSLDDFEGLLALAARGRSVPELLALKASPGRREQPFKSFLYDLAGSWRPLRLPISKQVVNQLFARSMRTLFGQIDVPPIPDPEEDGSL